MTLPASVRAERYYSPTENGCWEWQGCITPAGYGQIGNPSGSTLAHRVVYEAYRGPIEPGLQIDHLCRNRRCVNPAHLEPVTPAENTRRGAPATKRTCNHGHPYDPLTAYRAPDGWRGCRECARLRAAKNRAAGYVTPVRITCSDCGEEHPLTGRGLCRRCYTRWYRASRGGRRGQARRG